MIVTNFGQNNAPTITKALLIGDSPTRATAIKAMFSLIGSHFQIDETGDRCSAHDRLLEREYDLIIVDVRWSKWTETELIAEILRIYLHPRILFFAHSAHKDAIGGYVGQGCWAFVDKYDSKIADIRTAVGKLLDGKNYMSSILLTHLVG